jgi:tRNA nucleotidyltransferase (CCA-adding enzyme)
VLNKAKPILYKLEQNGYKAYFVGGCVRDTLLGRPIHDVDICTSAHPQQVQALFDHVIPTGVKHGTVTVLWDGLPVEVTTFRTEGKYTDHRRPDRVHFVSSLREDLMRRDFTVNALAMNAAGKVYDYAGGRHHLQRKLLVTVGLAKDRFSEDALRMLRAIRFAAQLGFAVDEQVIRAIQEQGKYLEQVAIERTTTEWRKMMASPSPQIGLQLMEASRISYNVLPFSHVRQTYAKGAAYPLHHLTEKERWALWLSLADHDAAHKFLRSLRLEKKFEADVRRLLRLLTQWPPEHESVDEINVPESKKNETSVHSKQRLGPWSRYDLYRIGENDLSAVLKMAQLKHDGKWRDDRQRDWQRWTASFFDSLPIRSVSQLQVKGEDIIHACNKEPGPWVGRCLTTLERAVVEGRVPNDTDSLLRYASSTDGA